MELGSKEVGLENLGNEVVIDEKQEREREGGRVRFE